MRRGAAWIIAVLVLAAWAFGVARDYLDRGSPAHESMQYALKAYGQAVYDYHRETGQWPVRSDQLEPRFRRETANLVVLIPHPDLKDDPKQNGEAVIAWYRGGVFSKLGRVWVCRGDLRTEYMKIDELRRMGVPAPE